MTDKETRELEIELLLEAIFRRYGYDFRHYAKASLVRRVTALMSIHGLDYISDILPRILWNREMFSDFLRQMSITVTEMFRDPAFYATVRTHVLPYLATYPLIRVWHAGCATGEEVYSMAITLMQEGLYQRAHLYATDFNNESLDTAKAGVYPLDKMRQFMANHNRSAPKGSFSDYYVANDHSARFVDALRQHITFANHNLVTDGVFGEMNMIVCRNVLIYFDRELQNRVLNLFSESLAHRGFLCLGPKESIEFSSIATQFEPVSKKDRVYQKLGPQKPAVGRSVADNV